MLTRPASRSGTDHVAVGITALLDVHLEIGQIRDRTNIPASPFTDEPAARMPGLESFYLGKKPPKRLLQKPTGPVRLLLVNHNLRQDHRVGWVGCCLKILLEV